MKSKISLLIIIGLMLLVFPFIANADLYTNGACGDNVYWTLNDNGVLTISGIGKMDSYELNPRPWENDRERIRSVVIQPGVTTIGNRAFDRLVNLTDITIPSGVTRIEASAMSNCTQLAWLDLPGSVTYLGTGFIFNTAITNFTVPSGVTQIETGTFYGCQNLKSIFVAEGNTSYTSKDGVLFNRNMTELIRYPEAKDGASYTIPGSVQRIGRDAFRMSRPEAITIPGSVTSIGTTAFFGCKNLKTIEIPGSVKSIGNGAFCNCGALAAAKLNEGIQEIQENAFNGCGFSSVSIPSSVTAIESRAFYFCRNLTEVYYAGAENRWNMIAIGEGNERLINAVKRYNSVQAEPALMNVQFSTGKATVGQNVTINAVTNTNATMLTLYAGGKAIQSWRSGYTDSGNTRTWKVTYAFEGAGERTVDFRAANANGVLSAPRSASITITKAPALTSVYFSKARATVKQDVTIIAVTNTNAVRLTLYAGSKAIQSWTAGYTDNGNTRTWKVNYAFEGAGDRTVEFRASDPNGVQTEARAAGITITKAPALSSVKFSKDQARLNEEITITAVTSITTSKLTMYVGDKAVKSWTEGYTDKDGKRTWRIGYAFSGTGNRTLDFRGFDSNGVGTEAKTATIQITK